MKSETMTDEGLQSYRRALVSALEAGGTFGDPMVIQFVDELIARRARCAALEVTLAKVLENLQEAVEQFHIIDPEHMMDKWRAVLEDK